MKKSLLVLPLALISLSGCNPPTTSDTSGDLGDLLSIEIVSGLKEQYVQYEIVEQDKVVLLAEYENGIVTTNGDELTFNPSIFDTSNIGIFELSVTYMTMTIQWNYEVFENNGIEGIETPDSIKDYSDNIKGQSVSNKRKEFMDRDQGYLVGDDNPFVFIPVIYTYIDDEELYVNGYHSASIIREKRNDDWVILSEGEIGDIVSVNEYKSSYDFTETAIGHTYRLTVRPYGEKYATGDQFVVSFEFTICDGYNVYSQDDLTHFDNLNPLWDSYREEKGIVHQDIDGIVLHNDIKIRAANIPDGFFYTEGDSDVLPTDADIARVYGSLRDEIDLYHRNILPGESFTFNGNYFNIDYSSLPLVVRERGRIDAEAGRVVSHATVIKAGVGEVDGDLADYTMKNLSVVGNANRTEILEKSGGAIFTKLLSVDSHIYNMIATQCFTIILTELSGPNVIIEKTRGYDSYSSMLYNYGTNNLLIKDSEFIGAGGPIIINDHVDPTADGSGGYQPHTLVENSVMESFVTGSENWFKLVYADTAVPGILGIGENLLPAYGTNSITKMININGKDVPHFNLIALIKDGAAASPTSSKINGSFTIDDGTPLDFSGPFMTAVDALRHSMPRFQSSDGQTALFDGEKLVDTNEQSITPYQYTNTNYFTGDYMNLYYNIGGGGDGFMGLVFGLVDTAA